MCIRDSPEVDRLLTEHLSRIERRLVAGQVLLPFRGRIQSREVAFLTTARDIMEFVNWYQRDNRRMYGIMERFESITEYSSPEIVHTLDDIDMNLAKNILYRLYTHGVTIISIHQYYRFKLLPYDALSPLRPNMIGLFRQPGGLVLSLIHISEPTRPY